MSFTGSEIKQLAEEYIGTEMTDEVAVLIINDGLNRLGMLGYVFAEATIEAEKMEWYELPDDRTEVLYVSEDNKPFYGWEYESGNIRFRKEGTYTVSARRMAEPIEEIDDEIELADVYKSCLVSYYIGFVKLRDDDESPDGYRNMQEFEKYAVKAYQMLVRKRKLTQVKVIR